MALAAHDQAMRYELGHQIWSLRANLGPAGGTAFVAAASPAAGVSAGLTSGVLLEAHVVRGHESEHSWSVGARMLF